jgi:broad specificity phosphatase PhoE
MAPERLILVKHAWPDVDPGRPAAEWPLSARGRTDAAALAVQLAPYTPGRVVASAEPKARDTGRALADALGVPFAIRPGLHEHERRTTPYLPKAEFEAAVARFFAEPDALVLGEETARAARARFAAAVDAAVTEPGGTPVVVAHGTVIALYLADRLGVDPFATWTALGLPSYAVVGGAPPRLEALVGAPPPADGC